VGLRTKEPSRIAADGRSAGAELEVVLKEQAFPFRDEAAFGFGLIRSQMGEDHAAAAKAFFDVASMPNSPRSPQATLFTGRELLAAKSYAEAEKWFEEAVNAKGKQLARSGAAGSCRRVCSEESRRKPSKLRRLFCR
jgi:hypothetical protein